MSDSSVSKPRKTRRQLPPSAKYELWISVLTQQATQREPAEKYKVDRSTVVQVCKVAKQGALDALPAAKPGRPGQSLEQAQLAEAKAEIDRLRATVTEQAVALHLHHRVGLSAGPVPSRVDANVKAGLLDLDENRATRWTRRRTDGGVDRLDDARPGGHPLHGLLDAEREAILDLFEAWGGTDRSHRKLAHRGSRLDLVHVSESTVRRVLADHGMVLHGPAPREPAEKTPWPEWLEWKPNRIWAYDFTHFTRARRAVIAVLDMVSRKWIATLASPEETSAQVETCFLTGLEAPSSRTGHWRTCRRGSRRPTPPGSPGW